MRLNLNIEKGARPQTDNIYKTAQIRFSYQYEKKVDTAKKLFTRFLSKTRSGQLIKDQKTTMLRRLGMWYVTHQLLSTKFYKDNVNPFNKGRFWIDMIEKYHEEIADDLILF